MDPPIDTRERRFDLKGGSLRRHAARGAVINAVFMVGLAFLSMTKGFVVASFLDRSDYGVWGILAASLGTLLWLRQVGIGDKYVQQDEDDQELAYQKAFTLELMLALLSLAVLAPLVPLIAAVYGQPQIVAPAFVALLALPAAALSTPVWVYYRQMRFLRQRAVLAVDPVVGFVVTVALAAAGAGYWSFVIGLLAGAWATALVSVVLTPVRLAWRFDRATLRSYAGFSWPLFAAAGSAVVLAQSSVLATDAHLGLAAVGAVALAANVTQFANRVQQLVTGTLYPAICAVRDRTDLLRESFLKSNQLGMMWGVPFGVGLSLFFADLVEFGIGSEWNESITLIQVTGLAVAMSQICFNWDAFLRALDRTRPIAVTGWAATLTFLVAGIPLLIAFDLRGLAAGIALQGVAALVCRIYYLHDLFGDLQIVRHALSGIVPVLPGTAAVLAMRLLESGDRAGVAAIAELAVFVALTAAVTWLREAPLLREAVGYLGGGRRQAADVVV